SLPDRMCSWIARSLARSLISDPPGCSTKLVPLKWPARSSVIWLPVPGALVGFWWQLTHETLLNTGPMPLAKSSTSSNVSSASDRTWPGGALKPLRAPSKPVGASVTALTCGPWGPSSSEIAMPTLGSCDPGSGDGDEHDATISELGSSKE